MSNKTKHAGNDTASFVNLVRSVAIDVQVSKYTHQQVGEQMNVIRDTADEFFSHILQDKRESTSGLSELETALNESAAKDARLTALEAENAALKALLLAAGDALAPVASAVAYDGNLASVFEDGQLIIETPDRFEEIHVSAWDGNKGDCLLRVRHLRALAAVAAQIAALKGEG